MSFIISTHLDLDHTKNDKSKFKQNNRTLIHFVEQPYGHDLWDSFLYKKMVTQNKSGLYVSKYCHVINKIPVELSKFISFGFNFNLKTERNFNSLLVLKRGDSMADLSLILSHVDPHGQIDPWTPYKILPSCPNLKILNLEHYQYTLLKVVGSCLFKIFCPFLKLEWQNQAS